MRSVDSALRQFEARGLIGPFGFRVLWASGSSLRGPWVPHLCGLGFWVWDLWLRVWGTGFELLGL